jgi:hypothetical protein
MHSQAKLAKLENEESVKFFTSWLPVSRKIKPAGIDRSNMRNLQRFWCKLALEGVYLATVRGYTSTPV